MNKSELQIRDISDATYSSAGGEKKILICDKLDPAGLQLVFHDEQSGWSELGQFSPSDVHHKSCVVFRTPAYPGMEQETTVKMEMRMEDGESVSNSIDFTYYPKKKIISVKREHPAHVKLISEPSNMKEAKVSDGNSYPFKE